MAGLKSPMSGRFPILIFLPENIIFTSRLPTMKVNGLIKQDGRSRPAPYRNPAQTMRHRPGTGYRPGERLRTRAPARRNRTGCRRRVDFTRSPAPIIDPVAPNCGNPFRKSDSGKTLRLRGHSDGFPHEMKWLRNSHTESMTSGFFEPAALLPTIFGIGLHPEKTPRFLLFGQKIVYLHSPKWDYN